MSELMAPMLQRRAFGDRDAILVTPEADGFRLMRRVKGRLQPASAGHAGEDELRGVLADRKSREGLVMVLPDPLLVREVVLPLAAEANLDQVLRYEMDRLTPFTPDQVFFSHRVLAHDRAQGLVRVEMALAIRAQVSPWLEALRAAGAAPDTLEGVGPDRHQRQISLVAPDPKRLARARRAARMSAAFCLVMAAAVLVFPLVRQSLALNEVETRIAAYRPRVQEVEALRRRVLSGAAGAGQIAVLREKAMLAVQVLGTLTDALPDDTWLTSLSLHQTRLVLEGRAAAASKLIAVLAAEPRLKDPAFAAPVVRAENGTDIFTIQAGVGS